MYVVLENARLKRSALRHAPALAAFVLVGALAGCGGQQPALTSDPAADLAGAAAEARQGRIRQPDQPYWPHRLAQLEASSGQTATAHAHLDTALALDPDYAPAVALRSKLLYQERRHDEAIALLNEHLARNPGADDALRAALALNLDAVGAWEESDAALARCGDASAGVSTVRTFLGLRGENPRAAADEAARALRAAPESAVNLNNQGIALLYAGQPTAAREAFLAALERNPNLPGALYNLAIVDTYYFYDEAAGRRWFARYRTLASDDPDDLARDLGETVTASVGKEMP